MRRGSWSRDGRDYERRRTLGSENSRHKDRSMERQRNRERERDRSRDRDRDRVPALVVCGHNVK
jgi:hypothetical protein